MNRLSSNWTIFWKIFIPTFYGSFFGILLIVMFLADPADLGMVGYPMVKVVYFFLLAAMSTLIWFTIGNLKRVELDKSNLYISNYLKTIRVHKDAIISVKKQNILFFNLVSIRFSVPTRFGKRIFFIQEPVAKGVIDDFIAEHQN